jgi:hypothetical protein
MLITTLAIFFIAILATISLVINILYKVLTHQAAAIVGKHIKTDNDILLVILTCIAWTMFLLCLLITLGVTL